MTMPRTIDKHAYRVRSLQMVLLYRDGRTLAEIGDLFGVSYERVRQLIAEIQGDKWTRVTRLERRRDRLQDELADIEQRLSERWLDEQLDESPIPSGPAEWLASLGDDGQERR